MQSSIYLYAVKYLFLLLPIIIVKYSSLCSQVFTPMQWSIYPYAVKYLSLLLPIIVVKYSSLCSEVFTPMQWSIYPYVASRRRKYLLKKEVVSIYYSGPSAEILRELVVRGFI